ncbi:coiled-coil domain-containing protein [Acidaminobacter hydrogenoformans]|uniref:N-terminal domain of peptidoglycan hydrolase CwlO-containing protein n=1 Tax=Acidaminobacter hydrogenoformans DSM 2784 TaxID=1120920 RepID=A0A1G5RVM5_9FIRM|nr:hypothetical protein [Acidaminobacter hydrogenoformans]SCZ78164.1 N-terminal domain of peptidoglycan hydrolase CwlO-containing protein [Acidaminobacter hydrogenoformans DSM 2784]
MQDRRLSCGVKCGGGGGCGDHRQYAFAFGFGFGLGRGFERVKMKLTTFSPWIAIVLVAATVSSSALPVVFATSTAPSPPSQAHTPIAQETLDAIAALNTEVLDLLTELFETASRITQLEDEVLAIQTDIKAVQLDIEVKQAGIDAQTLVYQQVRRTLGEVLRSQQRAGVASRLEIVLNAGSLKDLLRRLNLLRALSRKTDLLMQEAEAARTALEGEKAALTKVLAVRREKESALEEVLDSLKEARETLEAQLAALEDDRAGYEASLKALDQGWTAFKPVFTDTAAALSEMIETGKVPEGTLEIEFNLFQATGRITDEKLNFAVAQDKTLPPLVFAFTTKGAVMKFVDQDAALSGRFEVADQSTLKFVIEGGTFKGVSMSEAALEDLVSRGTLVFDLSGTIGKSKLRQVRHNRGAIELLIDVILF